MQKAHPLPVAPAVSEQTGGNTRVLVDTNGALADGEVAVATLTGLHDTVRILYNTTDETDVPFVA